MFIRTLLKSFAGPSKPPALQAAAGTGVIEIDDHVGFRGSARCRVQPGAEVHAEAQPALLRASGASELAGGHAPQNKSFYFAWLVAGTACYTISSGMTLSGFLQCAGGAATGSASASSLAKRSSHQFACLRSIRARGTDSPQEQTTGLYGCLRGAHIPDLCMLTGNSIPDVNQRSGHADFPCRIGLPVEQRRMSL